MTNDKRYRISQPQTEVHVDPEGTVIIEQAQQFSTDTADVYIDAAFLPTFIEWLQTFLPKGKE